MNNVDIKLNNIFNKINNLKKNIVEQVEQVKKIIEAKKQQVKEYENLAHSIDVLKKVVENDKNWHFKIKDNGIGIDKEFHDKIFVIFQRLHTKQEYSGSGMGLAIVKKIIEDHKGKIWAESVEGEGTAMHINLLKYKDNSHYCIEDKSGKKSAKGLR